MSKLTVRDKQELGKIIAMLKHGPASLAEKDYPFTTAEPEARRKYLHDQYLIWVNSWITPKLERMLEEQRERDERAKKK